MKLSFLKDHPKGLYVLFFAEMWERFSYYGMRALLMLYITKKLLYGGAAFGIYGIYTGMVYATPILGGMLADRFLGYRRAIVLGGVLMALGHFMMAFTNEFFFFGAMALICVGNGFFKPNISSLVGKLYPEGDPKRDSGFTIFYMGINVGAFLAPLGCGLVGERFGWHYGFTLAGIGMVAGLFAFLKWQKYFESHGLPPAPEKLSQRWAGIPRLQWLYFTSVAAVPLVALGLKKNALVGDMLYVVAAGILIYLLYVAFTSEKVERDRLLSLLVLIVFGTVFWSFFEQAGSSLNLFADRNVDKNILGWVMPTSWAQSFNPFFIVIFAPLFSKFWINLQKSGRNPSIPLKFVLALVQMGLGFGALVYGASLAKSTGQTALLWLVLAYMLHTTGELCLSPVGLSAITKLSPVKLVGTVMGVWFLSLSFANYLGGVIAKWTHIPDEAGIKATAVLDPFVSLGVYTHVYRNIFWMSIGAALLLLLLTPLLKRGMHGVE